MQPTAFAVEVSDYEEAAQMQHRCRSRGIAGSTIELPDLSVAYRPKLAVLHDGPLWQA
jgi:hypothetical protein